MNTCIVIGGGAAGMMAAIRAASRGCHVELYEKNEKLGKKLFITGKGRCNVTNDCEPEVFFDNIVSNDKFLYSAYYSFSNTDVINLLSEAGCKLKTERGNRVFPESDHSSDIIKTLHALLKKYGVDIKFNTEVKELLIKKNGKNTSLNSIEGVRLRDGSKKYADCVIVATGGLSYSSTGSTGDGYSFARQAGHTIKECHPALVPFVVKESWCKELQGLSLKNVEITLFNDDKKVYDGFGEMLFTHFGISGPLILSASSLYVKRMYGKNAKLNLDLKPALTIEQLDKRLLRDFEKNQNRQFKNSLDELLPAKMIPVIVKLSEILPEKQVNEITKEERRRLIDLIKGMKMTITGVRGFEEAIITQGGINVKEVNPSTMESKIIKNLYFAGELLDVDAMTGGFNLQIAWSTGYLAGENI